MDDIDIIKQRIKPLDNVKISNKLFNKLSREFAKDLIDTIGLEQLNKIKLCAPLRGKYFQLQYVNFI